MSCNQVIGTPAATRLAINGSAGADVSFDFDLITTNTGVERIQPASRVDIRNVTGTDGTRIAGLAGEIAAGRYFTIPAGSVLSIDGPVSVSKLFFRNDAVGASTVEILVWR